MPRFLPELLDTIRLEAAPAGRVVLEALTAVKWIEGCRKIESGEVPLELVRGPWRELVLTGEGLVDRAGPTAPSAAPP